MNRREFLGAGAATAVATSSNFFALDAFAENPTGSYKSIYKPLDHFVEQYLRSMNAPGLTLVLADRDAGLPSESCGSIRNPVDARAARRQRIARGSRDSSGNVYRKRRRFCRRLPFR